MKIYTYISKEFTQEQVIRMVSKYSLFDRAIAKNSGYATEELIMIIKAVELVESL
jgi:hypothetical protein